jgi:hypothetical protein
MLSEEELKGVPLLVFCNKQDVGGALKPEEISEQLGLAGGEKTRPWSVRGSCATKGEGLEDGLDWYAPIKLQFVIVRKVLMRSGLQASECDTKEIIIRSLPTLSHCGFLNFAYCTAFI